MKLSEEKRYAHLSPFELKNKLLELANEHHEKMMLNAGRGNPNWVATIPRQGFFQFGLFAANESNRVPVHKPFLGGIAEKSGIATRFEDFLQQHANEAGIDFLQRSFSYVVDELKIDANDFVFEMVDAILGDHYPTPDRALTNAEKIIHKYLMREMCADDPNFGIMDLFPTEGGTAAMSYVFNTLMENHLLHKGDTIALGSPIFTPYIEIPRLNDFKFVELEVMQDENNAWQYPDSEIAKLEDPSVKAFFLVNPSNPTAVSMHQDTLDKITNLVKTKRQDLIILTDDVYGTFVNGFKSLMHAAPYNTILVYSYSKYFGATGWRLGVIGMHKDNVFDQKIDNYSEYLKHQLKVRYETVVLDPKHMKLIDRMVADSRLVALHHTAGLSTPQQVLMTFFSLSCLIDKEQNYKQSAQHIVKKRINLLYTAIGIPSPDSPYSTNYYTTIDIPELAKARYGKEFAEHLTTDYPKIDFVIRLAEDKSVVLMDGGGFDAPNMSVRVSLANLNDDAYTKIGTAINELLEEYYTRWKH